MAAWVDADWDGIEGEFRVNGMIQDDYHIGFVKDICVNSIVLSKTVPTVKLFDLDLYWLLVMAQILKITIFGRARLEATRTSPEKKSATGPRNQMGF